LGGVAGSGDSNNTAGTSGENGTAKAIAI